MVFVMHKYWFKYTGRKKKADQVKEAEEKIRRLTFLVGIRL